MQGLTLTLICVALVLVIAIYSSEPSSASREYIRYEVIAVDLGYPDYLCLLELMMRPDSSWAAVGVQYIPKQIILKQFKP